MALVSSSHLSVKVLKKNMFTRYNFWSYIFCAVLQYWIHTIIIIVTLDININIKVKAAQVSKRLDHYKHFSPQYYTNKDPHFNINTVY